MFELLFNYPLSIWQDAKLVFNSDWSVFVLLLLLLGAVVASAFSVWPRDLSLSRRCSVVALQSALAAVVLCMLWQPALLVSLSEPGENTVAWLIDHSASMSREDVAADAASSTEQRLAAVVSAARVQTDSGRSRFEADYYAIGNELQAVPTLDALQGLPSASRSALATGLDTLLGTINENALAAVVLLSDGADNSAQLSAQWWQSLAAAGVPVHTVGVGQSVNRTDLELVDVSLPEHLPPDTTVSARLRIRHGTGGTVRARVLSGSSLLAAEDLILPAGVDSSLHDIRFSSGISGIKQLEFVLDQALEAGSQQFTVDPVPENNRQPRIIQVADSPKRILYVEGEPRWEYKFLRRALDQHPGIQLVSLLRTSPNKFYRQGVADGSELANGFPAQRETLFSYDAIIIGSFEAAELSTSQQSHLRDFVSVRGGSLLMLAGREGLADGGWGRSVVAAALPVVLGSRLTSTTFERERVRAIPTLAGLRTPWLQLNEGASVDDSANLDAWQGLPALADVQSVGQPKPGAMSLLSRSSLTPGARLTEPLLVVQRYGRGSSAVLGTSGTWRWQMSLPSDDERHERFWRQLAGMLVQHSVPRLALDISEPVVRDAESAQVSIEAYNADYSPVQQARFPINLTQPDGSVMAIELAADAQQPGRFSGEVPVAADGPYAVMATSTFNGEAPQRTPSSVEHWWVGESGNAEHFNAGLNEGFLRRVAEVTGGSYLPLSDIEELQTILSRENAALKRESRLPLWNMPILFLGVFLLKALEWLLRLKWKRL